MFRSSTSINRSEKDLIRLVRRGAEPLKLLMLS